MRYFVDTPMFAEDNMYARVNNEVVETRFVGQSCWKLFKGMKADELETMASAGFLEEVTEVPFHD